MTRLVKALALTLALTLTVGLPVSCNQDVPDDPIEDDPKDDPDPEQEPEDTFQIDIAAALDKDGTVVKEWKTNTSWSPHKGIYVTTLTYTDHDDNPQAAFFMQVNLNEPTLDMVCTLPENATETLVNKREKLSEQFKHIDKEGSWVMGGVNTDFFVTDEGSSCGYPQGAIYHNYVCLKSTFASQKTRPRCTVSWGEEKKVTILTYAKYQASLPAKYRELFSGGQMLVKDGKPSTITEDSVYGVHPRTMFGVSEDGMRVTMVVIDGRREGYSIGVNYPDMQKIMIAAGCYDALNLDGGGSSTFIVRKDGADYYSATRFAVRNRPSDGTERAIGPGLAIIAKDDD